METIAKDLKNMNISTKISQPATDFLRKEKGLSSLFLIDVKPGSKAFRYDIDIVNVQRQKSLTKGADDGQRSLNRNLCYELLTAAYAKTDCFGMSAGSEVVYDCKSTMYTSSPVNLDLPDSCVTINNDEVNEYVQMYCGSQMYAVKIVPNSSDHILDLCDLEQYKTKRSLYNEDRSVRTFLEMAITQFALNSNMYTPIGAGKMFEVNPDNSQIADGGIILRSGIAKGVRVVQNYGDPKPALVLDAKVCPFYMPGNLMDTVMQISRQRVPRTPHDWNRIRASLQDVRVEVGYARHRSFGIGRFTDKPMGQLMVNYEGSKVPMPIYYKERYNIDVRYIDFPAVVPNTPVPRGKPVELFPIEQLFIMDDQRVPLEKMDKNLSAKLLKANSITPNERLNKIMRHANDMAIFNDNNAVLSAFGIRVNMDSNGITIGVRACPRIRFANDQVVEPNPDFAEWRKAANNSQYINSCEVINWIVLCDNENKGMVGKFINVMMIAARKKGMNFVKPPTITTFNSSCRWTETFERCINKNVEFVVLIDPKSEDTHGLLKYYEARYKVITQHITVERVVDVVKNGKAQTLDNILNKINCKNFGLNYIPIVEGVATRFDLSTNNILVIGYDVAHPPPVTHQERRLLQAKGMSVDSLDPSVVGIVGNFAKNPHNFVGDYFYQDSRKEAVDPIQLMERTMWILQNLEKYRPAGARPKHIIVLRDGISEGQYEMAIEEELKAIRTGCYEHDNSYSPKFLFVIGTKRHFKKFFTEKNGRFENLAPGSVIFDKVTREDCPEFFMQSHYPLKGVGKPVEYNIPVDEIGVTQAELQGFLNALCYSHQIVNSAVSLPVPIYQADELAKRGRNNYVAMKTVERDNIPRLASKLVNARELTRMLSYKDHRLCATRFSA